MLFFTNFFYLLFFWQRRSLAPSQLTGTGQSSKSSLQRSGLLASTSGLKPFKSPFTDSPIPKRKCREERKENRMITSTRPNVSINVYEDLVAKVLSKPFKVPILDYVPDTHGNKCLGLRRNTFRRALHDPNACNALVLYIPPDAGPISEHARLKMDTSKILVHVVVDPVVGHILRPHQREGVRFMYDCVTGAKGEFQGCIMADEVWLLSHVYPRLISK